MLLRPQADPPTEDEPTHHCSSTLPLPSPEVAASDARPTERRSQDRLRSALTLCVRVPFAVFYHARMHVRFATIRWMAVVAIFIVGFFASAALQSTWWEAHPTSCMPGFEINEPSATISPNCLLIRHYLLIDMGVATLLSLLAWRLSRSSEEDFAALPGGTQPT